MLRSLKDVQIAVEAALFAHGASAGHAAATGRSLVAAAAERNLIMGLPHTADYCNALDDGRADGGAAPVVEHSASNVLSIDACGGFPHLGVDQAWPDFVAAAERGGVAILALRNGYTCGALGYFTRRLADGHGLAAIAAANAGPAVMPAAGGRRPVFCTNPLAFSMPSPGGASIVIDQSSSAGAYVSIRGAMDAGRPIPEGWALGPNGEPTTDPAAALAGVLLPRGGDKGANIALMVELMAAGMTGANWSHIAPPFNAGPDTPGVGLFVIAMNPGATGGGAGSDRLIDFMREEEAVYIPGPRKAAAAKAAAENGLAVDSDVWEALQTLAKT